MGGWGNAKLGKTIFPSITDVAQILSLVAQIRTNGALVIGKRKILKNTIFYIMGAGEMRKMKNRFFLV